MINSLFLIKKFMFKRGFQLSFAALLIFLYGLFKSFTIVSIFSLIDFFVKDENALLQESKIKGFTDKAIYYLKEIFFSKIDDNFVMILLLIGSLLFFAVIFNFLGLLLAARVQFLAFIEMQLNLTRIIANKNISFFDQNKIGELLSRINKDSRIIMDQVQNILMSVFAHLPTILILSVFLLLIDIKLTLFFILFFIFTVLLIFIMGNLIKKIGFEELNKEANLNGLILEILKNIKIIKIYNLGSLFSNYHNNSLQKLYQILMRRLTLKYFFPNFFVYIFFVFIFIILILKFNTTMFNQINNSDFITFIIISINLLIPFQKINETFTNIFNLSGNSIKINEIMNESNEKKLDLNEIVKFNNTINFKNINFTYTNKFSINNLSFNINKGEKIVIFGKSGSGKSTIIDLLLKFYSPLSGQITIDDLNYNNVNVNSLRDLFGVSLQDNLIFNDTIKNNIIFDKEFDKVLYQNAIYNSGLHEYIDSLPNKNETFLGDNGSRLSGGLKQRLSIARVLYSDNKIFIFDEVTAALDDKTENFILDNLFTKYQNKTIIMITHKKKLISYFDKILIMDNGTLKHINAVNK